MLFPPTNLVLVSQTVASAVLAWNRAPQTSTYNVYRDNVKIASGIAVLTYTDATVSASKRYRYAVSATSGGIETAQSNYLNVDILRGNTLTFESVYQLQPGEGGYPDVLWRWQ